MAFSSLDNQNGFTSDIRLFGDSLTAGAGGNGQNLETFLRMALQDKLITNYGIGGQTSEQIAARQGGLKLYISLQGGVFNSSTDVNITSMKSLVNGSLVNNYFLSTAADTNDRYMSGYVKGIRCLIKRTGSTDAYTILPIPSSTSTVDDNSIFYPDDAFNTKSHIQTIWLGRNNVPNMANVPSIIASCIDQLEMPKRFVVLGVLSGTSDPSNYLSSIISTNNILRDTYNERYVEMTAPTVAEMAEIAYTLQGGDQAQLDAGLFPTGMRADAVHLNRFGYNIVANRVVKKLKELNFS